MFYYFFKGCFFHISNALLKSSLNLISVITDNKERYMDKCNQVWICKRKSICLVGRRDGREFGFHSQDFNKKKSNLEIPRVDCVYLK